MNLNKRTINFIFLLLAAVSCSKDKNDNVVTPQASLKSVTYSIKGSNFNVSYIDSNSVYRENQVYKDSFNYQFNKGSGASIGLTVHAQSSSDTVYFWNIKIDGKLYANAFSDGGAFLSVPYN